MQVREHPYPTPQNPFLKVKCPSCGNEQIVYSAPATLVACLVCKNALVRSAAHKGKVEGEVLQRFAPPGQAGRRS